MTNTIPLTPPPVTTSTMFLPRQHNKNNEHTSDVSKRSPPIDIHFTPPMTESSHPVALPASPVLTPISPIYGNSKGISAPQLFYYPSTYLVGPLLHPTLPSHILHRPPPSPNTINLNVIDKKIILYKTEMCRTLQETGHCRYATKCQFAHSPSELRPVPRHPRYKTELCATYWERTGDCPYGRRCCFIHTEEEAKKVWGREWEERIGGPEKVKRLRVINKEVERREEECKSNGGPKTTGTPRYKQVLGSSLPNQHKQASLAVSSSEDNYSDYHYPECDTLLPADIIGLL